MGISDAGRAIQRDWEEAAIRAADPYAFREHYPVELQDSLFGDPGPEDLLIFASDLQCGCGCRRCELLNQWRAGTLDDAEWRVLLVLIRRGAGDSSPGP